MHTPTKHDGAARSQTNLTNSSQPRMPHAHDGVEKLWKDNSRSVCAAALCANFLESVRMPLCDF
jgi:hypothetical protein